MPTQQNAFIDKLLTNVSNKYVGDGFIAEKILPLLSVSQDSGKLGRYGTQHLRIETSATSGKNQYPRVTSNTHTTDTYQLVKHGLSDLVTEEDRQNFDAPFNDVEVDVTEDLTSKLLVEKEYGIASTLSNVAIITQNSSPVNKYGDYINSDPMADFALARRTVKSSTGKIVDTAIMSWEVFDTLSNHPALLEALKYTKDMNGGLNEAQMATALKVQRVLVGREIYDAAKEGQSANIQPIWSDVVVFAVSPTNPARKQISLGYRLQNGDPRRVFKNPVKNPPNATEILVDDKYQQLLVDVNAAYLLSNVL